MIAKSTLEILSSRFSVVYKVILYIVIIAVVIGALGFGTLYPTLKPVLNEIDELDIIPTFGQYIKALFQGSVGDALEMVKPHLSQGELYNQLVAKLHAAGDIFMAHPGAIGLSVFWVLLLVVLFVMSYAVLFFTVSEILNAFMRSNSEYGFIAGLVANIKKSLLFALTYVAVMIPVSAVCIGVCVGVGVLFSQINGLLGLMLTFATLIFVLAAQHALLMGWVPSMVRGNKGVIGGLKENFKVVKAKFFEALGFYFMFYFIELALMLLVGVITFGVGVVIVFAVALVLLQSTDLIYYSVHSGYRYYSDPYTVIDPKRKFRDAAYDMSKDDAAAVNGEGNAEPCVQAEADKDKTDEDAE